MRSDNLGARAGAAAGVLAVLGDGLGAVLDGGDVDHGVADRPGDVPGGGRGDPLAGLLWH